MTATNTNPTIECGILAGCCEGVELPTTLKATISDVDLCSCADGAEITLTYDSIAQYWTGSGNFGSCGRQVTLEFYCPTLGVWLLDLSFSDSCSADQTAISATSSICDPLSVGFDPAMFHESCCGGLGNMTSTISIEVTL